MKLKRICAALLACIMAASTLAGCGQTKEASKSSSESSSESKVESTAEAESSVADSTTAEAEDDSYFNATGFPIVKEGEEVTIRILMREYSTSTEYSKSADAPVFDFLEEKFNVKFEIESYTKQELADKVNLILADPDNMPDIFWWCKIYESDLMDAVDQGLFMPLDDLIDEYAPNITACLDSNDYYRSIATSADGHIYQFPSYAEQQWAWSIQINERWMENCGIEEYPTNLEELKEVLIKFRDMDANGNGDPNDEIPARGSMDGMWQVLFNAAGVQCAPPWIGAIYSSEAGSTETFPLYASEQYRYIMEYVRDLYKEGLISSDFLTVSSEEDEARRKNDEYGVLFRRMHGEKIDEKWNGDEWATMPLLTSDLNEEVDYFVNGDYETHLMLISGKTEYPEVCIRIMDYLYSADGTQLFTCYSNDDYDLAAAGVSQEIIDLTTSYEDRKWDLIPVYGSRWTGQLDRYKYDGEVEYLNNIYASAHENIEIPQGDKGILQYNDALKFTDEENEIIAQYQTDIDLYMQSRQAQWVVCNEELNDDTWNEYLSTLEAMHIDDLTEVYQAAVNRFYGVE